MPTNKLITRIGDFTVDYAGLLGAIIPFVSVVYALYSHVFVTAIPNDYLRFAITFSAAIFVEVYMIGVMVLDQRVRNFNSNIRAGEAQIKYNATLAKSFYIIAMLAVVAIEFVAPVVMDVSTGTINFIMIPLVMLSWFGYDLFSTGHVLREMYARRKEAGEAEVEKAKEDNNNLALSIEMQREKRLAAEAEATRADAEARKERETKLKERQRLKNKQQSQQPQKNTPATNGAGKSWRDYSLSEIVAARKNGSAPKVSIKNKAVEVRYKTLVAAFGTSEFSKPQAMKHVDISNSTFLNDMKALMWNDLVAVVNEVNGVYKFTGNNRVQPVSSEG